MKPGIEVAILYLLGALAPGVATSADAHAPVTRKGASAGPQEWTFAVAPYLWTAGVSGDTAQFGAPSVDLDMDFGNILRDLEIAAMLIGEARNGRYSLFGGGYSIVQEERGHLDLIAGVRFWDVGTDIAFRGGALDGVDVDDGDSWVDGIVGVRAQYSLTDTFHLSGWASIGAGGADSVWEITALAGYDFNDRITAVAGYRALGVDYSNRDFLYDIVQQGPVFGAVVCF